MPRIVINFNLLIGIHLQEIRIGRGWIKIFVRPNYNGHISFAGVLYAVRVARRNVNDFMAGAADLVVKNFVGKNLAETNNAFAGNDKKFFVL